MHNLTEEVVRLCVCVGAVVAAIAFAHAMGTGASGREGVRVLVGPNVLVSRRILLPQWEPFLAASPTDPDVLVGASTVLNPAPIGGNRTQVMALFTSTDEGASWRESFFPDAGVDGDPQTAVIGLHGTLLAMGMGFNDLVVTRSEDGGKFWSYPSRIASSTGTPQDHPQLTVDFSPKGLGERAYVWYNSFSKRGAALYLRRSNDGGRTWSGPTAVLGFDGLGYNTFKPLVLPDGKLSLPFQSFGKVGCTFWVVTSTNGGATFGPKRRIQNSTTCGADSNQRTMSPSFAADPSPLHRGRIYTALDEDGVSPERISVRYSDDLGKTWNKPAIVDPVAPSAKQWMPTITVSNAGVVGVTWFDNRNAPLGNTDAQFRDEYFAASVDGGATFLPSVRVSEHSASPQKNTPRVWTASDISYGKSNAMFFNLWGGRGGDDAGDYVGLAADARGVFHPFWPDASGTQPLVYTAAIEIRAASAAPPMHRITITPEDFAVESEPPVFDRQTGILEVALRARNLMKASIHAPLYLTAALTFGNEVFRFLNGDESTSASGKPEATYELQPALPDGTLFPGQSTVPFIVRLKALGDVPSGSLRGSLSFALSAEVRTLGR